MTTKKMNRNQKQLTTSSILTVLMAVVLLLPHVKCGWHQMLADAMGWNSGWESKGVTFGIKSKGMTAIIPIPLPIPIFSKDKKGSGGDSGGNNGGDGNGDNGGGGGDMKGGGMAGGWEMPPGGDWW